MVSVVMDVKAQREQNRFERQRKDMIADTAHRIECAAAALVANPKDAYEAIVQSHATVIVDAVIAVLREQATVIVDAVAAVLREREDIQ